MHSVNQFVEKMENRVLTNINELNQEILAQDFEMWQRKLFREFQKGNDIVRFSFQNIGVEVPNVTVRSSKWWRVNLSKTRNAEWVSVGIVMTSSCASLSPELNILIVLSQRWRERKKLELLCKVRTSCGQDDLVSVDDLVFHAESHVCKQRIVYKPVHVIWQRHRISLLIYCKNRSISCLCRWRKTPKLREETEWVPEKVLSSALWSTLVYKKWRKSIAES